MTNTELIEALRVFWPDNCQEAAAFLVALGECADAISCDGGTHIMPDDWMKFGAVAEALDAPVGDPAPVSSPQARLLEAAGQGGLTIESAASLLGVSRRQARKYLAGLRDAGSLQVHRQGRASRWVRDAE